MHDIFVGENGIAPRLFGRVKSNVRFFDEFTGRKRIGGEGRASDTDCHIAGLAAWIVPSLVQGALIWEGKRRLGDSTADALRNQKRFLGAGLGQMTTNSSPP